MTHPRVDVVVHSPLPNRWAHGVQVAHMCVAFAAEGAAVRLVIPEGGEAEDLAGFYGVAPSFEVLRVPSARLPGPGPVRRHARRLAFVAAAVRELREGRAGLVFTRDELVGAALSKVATTLYECHKFPERGLLIYGAAVRQCTGVVSTNRAKAAELGTRFGVAADRIAVCPNAVDVAAAERAVPDPTLRAQLGLGPADRLALYSGHLYGWKGVDTLAQAVEHLPDHVHVALLGGHDADVERFGERHRHGRLHLLGHRPPADVAGLLKAADVLVLPNSGRSEESRTQTSPLKLFEYMASGVPVVASDLPSLRERLDPTRGWLVPPDDAPALAAGICAVLSDAAAAARAERARASVAAWDWRARARAVMALAGRLG